jgi:hypothetical protein
MLWGNTPSCVIMSSFQSSFGSCLGALPGLRSRQTTSQGLVQWGSFLLSLLVPTRTMPLVTMGLP